MTKRADFGSAWTDEGVPSADMNDTDNAMIMRVSNFTAAPITSAPVGDFVDRTEFALDIPAGSYVIASNFRCNLRSSGAGGSADVNLKIEGANLGTKYFTQAFVNLATSDLDTASSQLSVTEGDRLFRVAGNSFQKMAINLPPFEIKDLVTTATVRLQGVTSDTAEVKGINLDVVFVEGFVQN